MPTQRALTSANTAGIPVIAYVRLLMDTDVVSYYATFDNKGVGTAIANYVVEKRCEDILTNNYAEECRNELGELNIYNGLIRI